MKQHLTEGQIVKSLLFNEPMRVETVRTYTSGTLTVGMVGTQTERFRRVILTSEEAAGLTILNEIYANISKLKALGIVERIGARKNWPVGWQAGKMSG